MRCVFMSRASPNEAAGVEFALRAESERGGGRRARQVGATHRATHTRVRSASRPGTLLLKMENATSCVEPRGHTATGPETTSRPSKPRRMNGGLTAPLRMCSVHPPRREVGGREVRSSRDVGESERRDHDDSGGTRGGERRDGPQSASRRASRRGSRRHPRARTRRKLARSPARATGCAASSRRPASRRGTFGAPRQPASAPSCRRARSTCRSSPPWARPACSRCPSMLSSPAGSPGRASCDRSFFFQPGGRGRIKEGDRLFSCCGDFDAVRRDRSISRRPSTPLTCLVKPEAREVVAAACRLEERREDACCRAGDARRVLEA